VAEKNHEGEGNERRAGDDQRPRDRLEEIDDSLDDALPVIAVIFPNGSLMSAA
jgi:hypothetical protein